MRRSNSRIVRTSLLLAAALWFHGVAASAEAAVGGEAPEGITLEIAQGVVDRVVPEVEELRGLAFKKPVPVEVVDDEFLRKYMLTRLRGFGQEQHLLNLQKAYATLGLIPEGTNVLAEMLGAVEEQAGGFYDPAAGTYYLLDDMPAATAAIFTVHELTHALEDQHFDLDDRLREVLDDDDRSFALSAVHEGSAMLLMSAYMIGAMTRGEMDMSALAALANSEASRADRLAALPPVLLRHLLGPYLLGVHFLVRGDVMSLAQGYPVESVNRTFRDGPVSSEQILHPEKYWDPDLRDDPREVDLRGAGKLLGKNWSLAGQGVIGEIGLGPLVGASTPAQATPSGFPDVAGWTHAASDGWDGDRWELWEGKAGTVVLLTTLWDSPEDAAEFTAALPPNESIRWRRDDDRVAIVAGAPGKRPHVCSTGCSRRGILLSRRPEPGRVSRPLSRRV